jgi:hypothetical protein
MDAIRQPDFKFKEEEEDPSNFDWDNMTSDEMDKAFKKIDESEDQEKQEVNRYKMLVPNYANVFFEKYLQIDNDKLGAHPTKEVLPILNYLEYGFELDMDHLELLNKNLGIVEFSKGNFPFGGMERFLITLKAFDLTPLECFDGFSIVEFNWTSDFEHDTIELSEKTKIYLKKLEY